MPCRRYRIHGRVQGVAYRDWCVAGARGLGLDGWVRNRSDGSVEAVAAGEAEALARFEAACRQGPSAARVDRIDVTAEAEAPAPGFARRATA